MYEFYALGLGDPIEVSAVHGHGTGDLLDACVASFPPDDGEEYDEDVIKVAIIGKPNVGKSSLLNKILGEERVIVSNIAGTTRDAIDSYFENESGKYPLYRYGRYAPQVEGRRCSREVFEPALHCRH